MNFTVAFLLAIALILAGYFLFVREDTNEAARSDHASEERIEEYEIHPSDVAEKVKREEKFILLDVRTLEEYEEVHLENALLLPVQELSAQSLAAIGLGEDMKDAEIVIYCRSGARSKTAYDIMNSLGYTNIKSVAGGMIHWEEDNYPYTESGAYTGPSVNSSSNEAQSAVETAGARIVLDRKLHDLGEIPQFGGTVSTTFTISNEGTEQLLIGAITTSCSCTSANVREDVVPVGGETILTVVFDPNFHEEPLDVFKRTVFIPTNDPLTPEAEVMIQVDIREGE